jgi:glycosyltransferase involved in cell wall biosynthesis
MRILLMADAPMNPDSGAAGTEYQTMMALRTLGHEVDAVWSDGLPHRIKHGNLHYLLELPRAYRKKLKDRQSVRHYDVVHVSQPHGYLAARFVRSLGDGRPVFVHRSHGFEPRVRAALLPWLGKFDAPRPVLRRFASAAMDALLDRHNKAIGREADGHIVSCGLCREYLHQVAGVSRSRIAVVPQAAPEGFLSSAPPALSAERLQRILYVGQFAFVKAPMVLANAFEQILRRQPNASLTWVCDARHHGDAAALLEPDVRERVRFLGWRPQDQLMDVYDAHGVFLFPSFFEGFGKAFLEAMSRGLVVVASAEGGAADLIEHGRNGMLAPAGDPDTLALACVAVQSDPALAQKIGAAARATALPYTWRRVGEETAAFYSRLIEQR